MLALRRRKLPSFHIARAAKLAKATVSRLLHRHRLRLTQLSPPPPVQRYERALPGELLHFYIKKLVPAEAAVYGTSGGWRMGEPSNAPAITGWEYLHIAIDDHSRLAFAQLLPDETAQSAIAFLHTALAFFQKHGIKAQRVYSDNGSCYRAHAMHAAVAALGLKHRFTRPYTQRPMARPSASSKPRCANGPTLMPTPTPISAQLASRSSSTTITGIARTTPSNSAPQSPDSVSH